MLKIIKCWERIALYVANLTSVISPTYETGPVNPFMVLRGRADYVSVVKV